LPVNVVLLAKVLSTSPPSLSIDCLDYKFHSWGWLSTLFHTFKKVKSSLSTNSLSYLSISMDSLSPTWSLGPLTPYKE
jgi:hypothetical protein